MTAMVIQSLAEWQPGYHGPAGSPREFGIKRTDGDEDHPPIGDQTR